MKKEIKHILADRKKIFFYIVISLIILNRQIPINYSYALLILMLLIFINKMLKKDSEIIIDYKYFPYIIYLLVMIAQILNSFTYVMDVSMSFSYMTNFFVAIMTMVIFQMKFNNNLDLKKFVLTYVVIVTVISSMTLFFHMYYLVTGIDNTEFISTFISSRYMGRGMGLYGNPNYYSVSLVMAVSLLLGMSYSKLINKDKLYYLVLIIISLDIFLTFSRGALFSFIAIVILSLLFNILKRGNASLKKIFVNILLLLLAILFTSVVQSTQFFSGFLDQTTSGITEVIEGTGSGRYNIWSDGFNIWKSEVHTIIFGVGGNNLELLSAYNHSPHNGYLRALYEFGIIGFTSLMLFLFTLIYKTFSFKVKEINFLFFPLVGFLVFGLSNDVFHLLEFWILCVLIFSWK